MDVRERILQLTRDYPGLHLRELARQADTSLNLTQYHLQRLEGDGHIEIGLDGGKVRVYPPDLRKADRPILAILRDRKRLRIVMQLLEAPATHRQLAEGLRMGKSTLSFHLKHLVEADIAEVVDHDYRLKDAKRVRQLLDKYRPTPDIADRLADVWKRVYGE